MTDLNSDGVTANRIIIDLLNEPDARMFLCALALVCTTLHYSCFVLRTVSASNTPAVTACLTHGSHYRCRFSCRCHTMTCCIDIKLGMQVGCWQWPTWHDCQLSCGDGCLVSGAHPLS